MRGRVAGELGRNRWCSRRARRDRGGAERLLHGAHAGERERAERDAVVGDLARDRLRALRLALGQVVLADDLPGGLDGSEPPLVKNTR